MGAVLAVVDDTAGGPEAAGAAEEPERTAAEGHR